MINSVVLVGRVGQDPEMKYFESGSVKAKVSLAVNRYSKEGNKTSWFNVELWGRQAEIAGEHVRKGNLISIEGKLDINIYTDKDGNKKEHYFIRGTRLVFLTSKKDVVEV